MIIEKIEKLIRANFECPQIFVRSHVLLASFPKSGNTWFRFVTSNILSQNLGNEQIDFYRIREFSPEIRGNRRLDKVVSCKQAPTFLKTHFYNVWGFRKYQAIVLYRNPLKTLQSYYIYMTKEQSKSYANFDEFINSSRVGIDAWNYFHKTWLKHPNALFISYDELIHNQYNGINTIYEKLGYSISKTILMNALEASSRENMVLLEKKVGDPSKKNKNYEFVGLKEDRYVIENQATTSKLISGTSQVFKALEKRKLKI